MKTFNTLRLALIIVVLLLVSWNERRISDSERMEESTKEALLTPSAQVFESQDLDTNQLVIPPLAINDK